MRLPGAVPLPGPHRAYGLQYDRTGFSVAANAPLLARAPLPTIVEGVVRPYKALGIPPARLAVSLPWYAYDFTCAGHARPRHTRVICLPAPSPTQTGARCTDGLATYGQVLDLHAASGSPHINFNETTVTQWFDYVNATTTQRHGVWFDDPETGQRRCCSSTQPCSSWGGRGGRLDHECCASCRSS